PAQEAASPRQRAGSANRSRTSPHSRSSVLPGNNLGDDGRRECLGVGVPALMGLAGAVLMAAPPRRTRQPGGPVSPGRRDDDITQEPQQLRDSDRDQPGVQV